MSKAHYLREYAALMFALCVVTRDERLRNRLALHASDYLDQALELERADPTAAQQPDHPEKE